MTASKLTPTEKEWIRLSMPVDHGETAFRLLLQPRFEEILEKNVNVKDVLKEMLEADLIEGQTSDRIRASSSNFQQLQLLLEEINRKSGPGTIERFLTCLRNAKYDHAATVIHNHLINQYAALTDSVREIQIKSGLVPTKPEFYVVRKKIIYEIKDKIIEASEKAVQEQNTHWILIHGMPGNGKSYLAAAALRSPEIWKLCFANGIYWLDIGKPGAEKLLIKLGVLCQMVGLKSNGALESLFNPHSSDVETVLQRLANAFATEFPNSAIVLDDVWDQSVIKAFEKVACRCIIVTSRRKDIVKPVKASVTYIDINAGFTKAESQEYLAQIMKKTVEELPTEAVLIHEKASGSPMVMALIGGMLRDHCDYPIQWKHYLTKLTDTPEKVMSMPSNSSYAHQSIDKAIALSVEGLKVDLREKFFDLAVFDDDVPVPQAVFRTLWSTQTEGDAADELAHFVNSSLCTRDFCPRRNCILYRFHDLILLYARNHIPIKKQWPEMTEDELHLAREKALQDKHRKLFMKYHSICNGRFEQLADDFYIHNFIGYHMSLGKMMADIKQLYGNSAFMEQRLAYTGAEVVLVDLLLLKKQHPSFTEQMDKLQIEVRQKFAVPLLSPDLKLKRRSQLIEGYLTRRASSASLTEIDFSKLKLSESGQGNDENTRDRASSAPAAASQPMKVAHSEPIIGRSGGRSRTPSSPLDEEDKENGDAVLPKTNVRSLYNDNFDDE